MEIHLRLMLLRFEMPKQNLEEKCDVEIKKGTAERTSVPAEEDVIQMSQDTAKKLEIAFII